MARRIAAPGKPSTPTALPPSFTQIAKDGASAFITGNVIGGVGISGLLLLMAAVYLAFQSPFAEVAPQLDAATFSLLLILGFLLVGGAGVLYILRKILEQRLLIALVNAHKEVTVAYISKVNEGTVSAEQVLQLSNSYDAKLAHLIGARPGEV